MCHDSADVLDSDFRDMLNSGQSLARILLDYAICTHCQHVYKIWTTAAHCCPACGGQIRTGQLYGPLTISSLIDVIQDHYRMELSRTNPTGERIVEHKEARHYVGIVLLFRTLVECWMEHFLWSLMISHRLPEPIIDQMLSDNLSIKARTGKLFKTLTDQAFGDALSDLTRENKNRGKGYVNYEAVWRFVKDVAADRNRIIHQGAIYGFPEDLVGKCIKNIHGVNSLFISLHNHYIAQGTESREARPDAAQSPD